MENFLLNVGLLFADKLGYVFYIFQCGLVRMSMKYTLKLCQHGQVRKHLNLIGATVKDQEASLYYMSGPNK